MFRYVYPYNYKSDYSWEVGWVWGKCTFLSCFPDFNIETEDVIMSYEYDIVLIFVSGCTDFLLIVVDASYGVHWLRLSSCLISRAPFCFPSSRLCFGMACAQRNNLVSRGHTPCESESVHHQCYEDGTQRWTSEYSCYFLPCLDHCRMRCGHALVVDWKMLCVWGKLFSRVNGRVTVIFGVVVVRCWASNTWTGFEILISC